MPLYDYECKECGVFEVVQSMHDAHFASCPKCQGSVTRLISGVIFMSKETDQDSYWTSKRRKTAMDCNQKMADAIGSGATVSNTHINPVTGENQQVPGWLTADLNSRIAEKTGRTRIA